ncbi:MAG: hypothetical protein RL110_1599 [Bacteroidota bacterium]|jgi:uncharacterized protein (DUF486 family)
MKGIYTLLLLIGSNIFMTLAWYGHLKWFGEKKWLRIGLFLTTLISWGLAFFEYCLQVPANRIGYRGNDGPFSIMQLKLIQEVLSIGVFLVFMLLFFKQETLKWNHFAAIACILAAVYFIFKK